MKKRLRKNLKRIIASILTITILAKIIIPFAEVFADGEYVLSFTANGEHEMENDNGHLKIDGQYVDLRDGNNNTIGEVNCTNSKSCTITVENGVGGSLNYNSANKFTLFMQGHEVEMNFNFSANENIAVQDYVAPHNPDEDDNTDQEPGEGFDGKAYLVWSCEEGICYHYFDNIIVNDDGTSTFYKASEVTDDKNNSIKFDIDAENKFFTSKSNFEGWQETYKTDNNLTSINWNTIDIENLIGPDGIDYQPVGEPYDNNAYVSYGDRNFKVVIYNDDYKGVSIGDLSDLNYYPASWANPFIRTDQYDISNTTKNNPTVIKTVLLENTINIKSLNYNSFEITSIEALDVPEGAVTITKVNNEFKIVFKSNFYDNVVFKVTDNNREVSYLKINRYTIDARLKFVNNKPTISADFSFDKNKSYTDFVITAKIVYKDGTSKIIDMTAVYGIDDGLGNLTESYEFNEETDDLGGNRGKGLKKSTFNYTLSSGEEDTISKVYINVEYKGNTDTEYAGAFAGSGKGIVLDFEEDA